MGRNMRQSTFIMTVVALVINLWNFGLLVYFYIQPTALFFMIACQGLLIDVWSQFAMFVSGLTCALGIALMFMPPSNGLATPMKIYALLSTISAIAWLMFSVVLGRNMQYLFVQWLPTTWFIKRAMKQFAAGKSMSGSANMIGGLVIGSALNQVMITMLESMLGEPLVWLLWAGIHPMYPILVFGLAPTLHALIAVSIYVSYAKILEAGGDGTEYVDADRIEWFYSLSKKDRYEVLDNHGNMDSSSSSSSSEDAESSTEKKKPEQPAAAKPTATSSVSKSAAAKTMAAKSQRVSVKKAPTEEEQQSDSAP